jgi:hypothetical protein
MPFLSLTQRLLVSSEIPTTATGGFLVFVAALRPATTFYPRRPVGRTRPMPYASMTLSGSREEKRTHLYCGESNSCPGT